MLCISGANKYFCGMNNDLIRLLPDSVANQIAAGEVIQRPSSVLKELVENAVDAGATAITINIKDAGRTLIQVVDNGCGMSPTDARMAFERHATSKISKADDLYRLHTMGFRGEALPSIAAVAQIDMRTMREGDTVGTRLLISESKFEGQEPVSCVPGTNLSVKNIFFHQPARRKFLKKDSVELGHILREVERLALVNTDVDVTLIHNDVTLHQFMRGSFKQRIGALFGKNIESQIAGISTETSIVKLSGFVGMPRVATKRGYNQFFDVNIHPQKHEIKFEHEQAISQILVAAIRETLGKTQAAGALDFEADVAPDIPLFNPEADMPVPGDDAESDFNPFRASSDNEMHAHTRQARAPKAAPVRDWDALYANFSRERSGAFEEQVPSGDEAADALFVADTPPAQQTAAACFQLQGGYIVSPSHSGIMVVSQHRAHVRIMYDRYMAQLADGPVPSQQLIFSENFELAPSVSAILESASATIASAGFSVSRAGDNKWSLDSVPASLSSGKAMEALYAILEDVEADVLVDASAFRSPVALAMARSAAISASQVLTPAEMESIIADLFRCAEPSFTPDGLAIMTVISHDDLAARMQ